MLGLMYGMSHRNSRNVGKWGGKDAKEEEEKGMKEKKTLLSLRRGKKEVVVTINLSKGNKTRFRSCSVPHPNFLWTNDQ